VLGLASLAYGGLDNHLRYLTDVLPKLATGYAFYPNQTWSGTFLRLSGTTPFAFALPPAATWVRVAGGLCAVVTLAAGAGILFVSGRRRAAAEDDAPLVLLFAWLVVTLASPVSWEHHYTPALFLFAWLFGEARSGRTSRTTVALACAAAPLVAGYLDVSTWPNHWASVLGMSYLLFGALLLAAGAARHLLRPPPAAG
jgi:hypothetical protein